MPIELDDKGCQPARKILFWEICISWKLLGTGLVTLTSIKFSCCTAKCGDIEVRNAIERTLHVAVLKYWGAGHATRPCRALGRLGKQPADEMLEHGRAACPISTESMMLDMLKVDQYPTSSYLNYKHPEVS